MSAGAQRAEDRARTEQSACAAAPLVHTILEERFERLERIAARALEAAHARIALLAERELWFRSRHGLRLSPLAQDDAFVGRLLASADGTLVERADQALAGVLLRAADGSAVGALVVAHAPGRALRADDLALLRDLALLAEDELRHMELSSSQQALLRELDQARRRSMTDPLTQVWNRAGLDELLRREIELAGSLAHPFAVAMIDIDHFKQVNDTYGHATGDGVLREFADRLRQAARPGDAVSRFGGEEFVVVLSNCAGDAAPAVADRLRRHVAAEVFEIGGGVRAALTCSAGVASWSAGERADLLLTRADIALYDAKRSGRNRVCVALDRSVHTPTVHP
ncbi:MAG: GGDEF domain-containing protein [Phycisphaerales bacterium]